MWVLVTKLEPEENTWLLISTGLAESRGLGGGQEGKCESEVVQKSSGQQWASLRFQGAGPGDLYLTFARLWGSV